jgi:hypothetical protein
MATHDELVEALRSLEWEGISFPDVPSCLFCRYPIDNQSHAPDCE